MTMPKSIQELAAFLLAGVLVSVGAALAILNALGVTHGGNTLPDWLTFGIGAAVQWAYGHVTQQSTAATVTNGMTDIAAKMSLSRAPSRSTDYPQPPPVIEHAGK